jgi:hypothetical protein
VVAQELKKEAKGNEKKPVADLDRQDHAKHSFQIVKRPEPVSLGFGHIRRSARRFRIKFRDRQVWLEEGKFIIVPRGVEHRPVAYDEVAVLLFEPDRGGDSAVGFADPQHS